MKRKDIQDIHVEMAARSLALVKAKNEDYATDEDPFANFRRVSDMGICSTPEGFLVRMVDKGSRLSTFAKRGEFSVQDEGLLDTCLDLINYTVLLYAWNISETED